MSLLASLVAASFVSGRLIAAALFFEAVLVGSDVQLSWVVRLVVVASTVSA